MRFQVGAIAADFPARTGEGRVSRAVVSRAWRPDESSVSSGLMQPVISLASNSPRRRELLSQIGVSHIVVAADIDESVLPGEQPRDYVVRLARKNAHAIRRTGHFLSVF